MPTISSLSTGCIHVKRHKITYCATRGYDTQHFGHKTGFVAIKQLYEPPKISFLLHSSLCSLWHVRCKRVLSVDSQVTFRSTVSIERPSQVKCEIGVGKRHEVFLPITDSWITALVVNFNFGIFSKNIEKRITWFERKNVNL